MSFAAGSRFQKPCKYHTFPLKYETNLDSGGISLSLKPLGPGSIILDCRSVLESGISRDLFWTNCDLFYNFGRHPTLALAKGVTDRMKKEYLGFDFQAFTSRHKELTRIDYLQKQQDVSFRALPEYCKTPE
jgi:hypothetical protein